MPSTHRGAFARHWQEIAGSFLKLGATAYGGPAITGIVCPMPPCRLENAEAFLALLERYPRLHGVISGHNHCAVDERHRGIQLLVTPSTYVYGEHPRGPQVPDARQFREVHGIDPGRRGFRRLELYPNGTLVTDVIWDQEGTPVGSSHNA